MAQHSFARVVALAGGLVVLLAIPGIFVQFPTISSAVLRLHVPGPKQETVRIIVQECCRDDLIDLQIQLFNKFLYESAEVVVVVATANATLQAALRAKSSSLHFTYSECPSAGLPECYDFSYRQWVSNFTGLVMFANDDMFLWRPFSVRQYKERWAFDIAAVVETHTSSDYLHPGLHIVDTATAPKSISNMTWGCCDVGARTTEWMLKYPEVKLHPIMWSRNMQPATLAAQRLIPLELAVLLDANQSKLFPDLYLEDFAILHSRGSSNWQQDPQMGRSTMDSVKQFLQLQLQNTTLTWSHKGASTHGALITKLSPHTSAWSHYQLVPSTQAHVALPTLGPEAQQALSWMQLLFMEAERIQTLVDAKKQEIGFAKLPLPQDDPPRRNLGLHPPRYDPVQYKNSTVYYWKYIYNNNTPVREPEFITSCGKRPGQKYWVATYAAGALRQRLAQSGLLPTCLRHGADEVVVWTPEDMDKQYRQRNALVLNDTHGVGNWAWKHYVQYQMLERMAPGDILAYMDSDMNCTVDLPSFFCLADKNDVTPFHHNHPWYTLSRLSKRDTLMFMDMDREGVAHSVQYSGGNVLFKKTQLTVRYLRELAGWSMQPDVIRGWQTPSTYSVDWPEYIQQGMRHQCDQAVSSVLIMKYGFKSYPWVMQGFGAGSDDVRNAAERNECGMPLHAQIRLDNLDR